MTDSIAPPAPPRPVTLAPSRVLLFVSWPLLLGLVGQFGIRLALTWSRSTPLIYPDESGYLLAARWLAGGPGADLSGLTSYQGGYALLLAPLYWISHDPEVVYRLAMGVNALIGAGLFFLGGMLLQRCGLPRERAFYLAWVAALLPATTLYGGLVMADAVLPAVVLAWLLALDRFLRNGGPRSAVAASVLAAYAYSIHMRGAVVLLVHAVVLVLWLARGKARRTTALAFAVTAVGAGAVTVLNGLIAEALYPAGTRDLGVILVDRMTSFDGQLRAFTGALGQIWSMMAGTWGLGALGLVAVVGAVLRRETRTEDRVMAGVLLAITAGIAYASSAALPNEYRVGNFVYGRYVTCIALVYALVGVAVLIRGKSVPRQIAAAAVTIVGAGLWLIVYLGDRLHEYATYSWDIPEIGLLGGSYNELRPLVISLVACALLAVLWALSRWASVAFVGVLLLLNIVLAWIPTTAWQVVEDLSPMTPLPGPRSGGVALAQHVAGVEHPGGDEAHPIPELVYSRLARQVWWTELQSFNPESGPPRPGVCTVITLWPAGVLAADTWPQHPAGWLHQRAGALGSLWWVIWYDPACT